MLQRTTKRIKQMANDLIDNTLAWLPTRVAEHLVNAQKEVLRAMQALIEEEIKWSDIHLARAKEIKSKAKEETSKVEKESPHGESANKGVTPTAM